MVRLVPFLWYGSLFPDKNKTQMTVSRHVLISPFASIGRTGMSKGKVRVRDICLNTVSDFLLDFSVFSLIAYMKKSSKSSLKKKVS